MKIAVSASLLLFLVLAGQPLLADDAAAYRARVEANWRHMDQVRAAAAGKRSAPKKEDPPTPVTVNDVKLVLQRGLKLAESQRVLGADVAKQERTLKNVEKALNSSADKQPAPEQLERLYNDARWAVRKMALGNPLLDFESVVFVKRAPGMFPHVSDQYYGWWSRGGGGICVLKDFKGPNPQVVCLTEDWAEGNFLRPELSYDGKKIIFAYCKHYPNISKVADKVDKDALPEDCFYNLFEMDVDGGNVKQLTRGRYDDFDGRYLPDGRIVFLSTRKGVALQAGRSSAEATADVTCPDSFVRCGGGNHRPVAVFTLHTIDADGGNLHAISAFENFEWTPAVAADGRIIYARWDYIDRFNGHFMSLWSTNPDGTNSQLVYGNYTKKPQCVFEARPIPNSTKLVFTATAHHSITGGSLCLFDRREGIEYERPITRITPEVPFPETEKNVNMYYAGPYPLSEEYFLVGVSDSMLPRHTLMHAADPKNPRNAMGMYLYDVFGNLELLHRDPEISSMNPAPLRPQFKPPAVSSVVEWDGPPRGAFLVQDVYEGLDGIERGDIKRLRVIGVLPKVQPHMNRPRLGISREETGKFILGTVPVEEDGSAYFQVPSGMSVFFQALDDQGRAVQTMRSLTYVQPGQTLSCVGCHESREAAPRVRATPLALSRAASRIKPGPTGTWPLRFDVLVQPLLDKKCISCHDPASKDKNASKMDLTAAKSYDTLLNFGDRDLHKLVVERDRSYVGDCPSAKSKIMAALTGEKSHYDVTLTAEDITRLTVWMDTYAHLQGAFSPQQEQELVEFREKMKDMLEE